MGIIVKNVFVKIHYSTDLIKCYHESLCRVYIIIIIEIFEINADLVLQMSFKVFNDLIKSNGFVFILLVFGVYLRMTDINASLFTFIQRTTAMRKTMNEMRKIYANHQINNVFNIWNDLNSILIHELFFSSFVLIYRESKTNQSNIWKKFHKIFDVQNETAIIKLFNEFIKFKTTSIKFYYQIDLNDEQNYFKNVASNFALNSANTAFVKDFVNNKNNEFENIIYNEFKNINKNIFAIRIKHGRDRIVKYSARINQIVFDVCFVFDDINIF